MSDAAPHDSPVHGPYDDPRIYDILHDRGAAADARGFVRIAARYVGRSRAEKGLWLEPASGTGRYMLALGRRGVRCVGVDLDEQMVRRGRERARAAGARSRLRLIVGDIRRIEQIVSKALPRARARGVDVAFCPDNSIRHLTSDAAMVEHLRGVRRLLRPGGVYLVGIGLMSDTGEFASEQVWHERKGSTVVRQVIEFVPPEQGAKGRAARVEMAYAHVSVSEPAGERDFLMRYALRTYTLAQWRAVIRTAGLREIGVVDMRARDLKLDRTMYAIRVLAQRTSRIEV